MIRLLKTKLIYWCMVGIAIANQWNRFSVERGMKLSCHFQKSWEKSVSMCVMSCSRDTSCVSASFSADVGWCQLSRDPCCLSPLGADDNWTTFRRTVQATHGTFRLANSEIGDITNIRRLTEGLPPWNEASCDKDSSQEETCIEDPETSLQTCFKLAEVEAKKADAMDHCLASGGELAQIHSGEQQHAIELYLAQRELSDIDVLTSGTRYTRKDGTIVYKWQFEGGSKKMVYENWDVDADPPQPYFTGSKKCVTLQPDRGYKWHLASCRHPLPFLCQFKDSNKD